MLTLLIYSTLRLTAHHQNLRYYGSNYLALYATLVALSIVTNPLSLGMLAVAGGGWWVLTKASSNPEVDTVNFGSFSVKKNVAYVVMMAVSVFVGVIVSPCLPAA